MSLKLFGLVFVGLVLFFREFCSRVWAVFGGSLLSIPDFGFLAFNLEETATYVDVRRFRLEMGPSVL